MQSYIQNKIYPFAYVICLRIQAIKVMKQIRNRPYINNKNKKRLTALIKTRKKLYRKLLLLLLPTLIVPLILTILWLFISCMLNGRLTLTTITPITYSAIFILLISICASLFIVSKKYKKQDGAKAFSNLSRISEETLEMAKKAYSNPFQISKIDIIGAITYSIITIFAICFISGPISVRNQKTFWITEIDSNTYVVPYVTNGEAVVKLVDINDGVSLKIYLNTQMRTVIDDRMLHRKEFSEVVWSEEYPI